VAAALFRYRLFDADGSSLGDAESAEPVKPGETIRTRHGRELRVLSLIEKNDSASEYAGFLMVEDAAQPLP
jgi:hypothetical protein